MSVVGNDGRAARGWRARSRVPPKENLRAAPPGRCGNRPLRRADARGSAFWVLGFPHPAGSVWGQTPAGGPALAPAADGHGSEVE